MRDHRGRSAVNMMRLCFVMRNHESTRSALLFPALKGDAALVKTVSGSWVRGRIKSMAVEHGRLAEDYSGHSLRAGGATDLFVARVPYYLIKRWDAGRVMRQWFTIVRKKMFAMQCQRRFRSLAGYR